MKSYVIILILFSIGLAGFRWVVVKEARRHFGLGLYLSFALATLAGFTLQNSAQFMLAIIAIFLLTVRGRVDALCRFVALAALVPNVHFNWRIGSVYIANIAVVDALILALALALLVFRNKPVGTASRFSVEDAVILSLVVVFGLGQDHGSGLTTTLRSVLVMVWGLGVPYYLFSRRVKDSQEYSQVVLMFGGVSAILAVLAIYEARFGWSLFDLIWRHLEIGDFVSRNLRIRGGFMRSPVSFNESTSFAVFQMAGVMAIAYSRRAFRSPMLWYGTFALSCIGLLAAQSRGAYVGILFGILAAFAFERRFGRVAGVVTAGFCGAALLLAAVPASPRIAALLGMEGKYTSGDYRQSLLQRSIEEGMKHPLFGDSIDNVLSRMTDLTQGEHIIDMVNTYLNIFLISGLIGLVAFLLPVSLLYAKIWRRPRGVMAEIGALRVRSFVIGTLTALLVALLFTSFYERNPLWLMIALAGAKILSRDKRRVPAAEGGNVAIPVHNKTEASIGALAADRHLATGSG